jgi:hypothetical protein
MISFHTRLLWCLKHGHLTMGDLRWWFGRSYATTASWVKEDRDPRGPAGDEARRRLVLLEKGITSKQGFPVPSSLSNLERPHHIEKIYNDLSAGVLGKNTASRRLQMRDGVS